MLQSMPGKSWSWTKRLRYALPRRLGSAWHALSLGIVPLVTSQSWLQALEEQRFPEKDPATEDENNDTEAEAEASSSKTVRFKKGRLKIQAKLFCARTTLQVMRQAMPRKTWRQTPQRW